MTNIITETTGKIPVVTIKENKDNIDIEKTWSKVNITSYDKFDRKKHTITKKNIQRGLSLLNDPKLKSEVKKTIQPFMIKY